MRLAVTSLSDLSDSLLRDLVLDRSAARLRHHRAHSHQ